MLYLVGKAKELRWVAALVAAVVVATACDLDVSDPSVIRDEELAGPSSVPTRINGVIGDLTQATENHVLYAGLYTDEFILAGTFPTRAEVDERRISRSNGTTTSEVAEVLQTAHDQADRLVNDFESFLGDEDFDQDDLRDGIAIGLFARAQIKLNMGTLYCSMPLDPGGAELSSDELVGQALADFQAAQSAASDAGLGNFMNASLVGQARAHRWLGAFDEAAAAAAQVPRSHRLEIEFSVNNPEQFNRVFDVTWGSQNAFIRWTVGDGGQPERFNEKFQTYDQFVDLGIIDPDPGDQFSAFNSSIAVHLQMQYFEPDQNIFLSSGTFADLIEAEAAIRDGNTGVAEDLINGLREDFDARWTVQRFPIESSLDDIALSGNLEDDLLQLSREYAREGWLTGFRQEWFRGLVREFGDDSALDLYPSKPGDEECWPIPEQEETGGTP